MYDIGYGSCVSLLAKLKTMNYDRSQDQHTPNAHPKGLRLLVNCLAFDLKVKCVASKKSTSLLELRKSLVSNGILQNRDLFTVLTLAYGTFHSLCTRDTRPCTNMPKHSITWVQSIRPEKTLCRYIRSYCASLERIDGSLKCCKRVSILRYLYINSYVMYIYIYVLIMIVKT